MPAQTEISCCWCGRIGTPTAPIFPYTELDPHDRRLPYACYLFDRKPPGWTVSLEAEPEWTCSEKCGEAKGQKIMIDLLSTGDPLPKKVVDFIILKQLRDRESGMEEVLESRKKSIIARVWGKK